MHIRSWVPHCAAPPNADIPTSGVTEPVSRLQLAPGRILSATVQGFTTDGRVHLLAGDVPLCAVPRGSALAAGTTVFLAVAQVKPDIVLRVLPAWVMNPHAAAHPREAGTSGSPGGGGLERWAAFARRHLHAAEARVSTQMDHVEFIRAALSLHAMIQALPRKHRNAARIRARESLDCLEEYLRRTLDDRTGTRRGASIHQSLFLDGGTPGAPTVRLHLFRGANDQASSDSHRFRTILLVVQTHTLGLVQALLTGDDYGGCISFRVDRETVRLHFTKHFDRLRHIIPRWHIAELICTVDDPGTRQRTLRRGGAGLDAMHPVDRWC